MNTYKYNNIECRDRNKKDAVKAIRDLIKAKYGKKLTLKEIAKKIVRY